MQGIPSTTQAGRAGEERATAYLEGQGWRILERNFRAQGGEVDIIALDRSAIVFVEVKSLPHGTPDTLAAVLGSAKQKKIIKTAKCYLQKYRQYNNRYVRFDVLALDVPGLDPVHHIANAFVE